jgi:membrane protein DedA with SNARE-associated domain
VLSVNGGWDHGRVPSDLPLAAAYAFLVVVAFCRGGATYLVGRLARRAKILDRPAVRRAERMVRRVGPPAVSLSFLTVGVQTAVNAAAGLLRMPGRHYVPALLVGALAWAAIYLTVGMAVVHAWLGARDGRWLLAALAAAAVVVAVSWRTRSTEVSPRAERVRRPR